MRLLIIEGSARLRAALEKLGQKEGKGLIKTRRGQGYILEGEAG